MHKSFLVIVFFVNVCWCWYDINKPRFHVIPASGYMADPDGLLFYKGDYHFMFQNNPNSINWVWGMEWGHVVCHGLLQCEHLPSSVAPSKDGADCSGCWSGQATVDENDVPVLIYTGSRRLDWPQCTGPTDYNPDPLQPYVETLMYAVVPYPKTDPNLSTWIKKGVLIPKPPDTGYLYHGWRDPFIYKKGNKQKNQEWLMVTAAGMLNDELESVMGAILIYTSKNLTCPECWEYKGIMAGGTYPDIIMWEAPWMFDINQNDHTQYTTILGFAGDKWDWNKPKDPIVRTGYRPNFGWLGNFNASTYKLDLSDQGPFLLDLGDAMYCPNEIIDDKDRRLLFGWVHECINGENACPNKATWGGAGSLTTPRKMRIVGEYLVQEPVEEMDELRQGIIPDSQFTNLELLPFQPYIVLEGQHYFMDYNISFQRFESEAVQITITRPTSAYISPHLIITYEWETTKLTMEWGSTTVPAPNSSTPNLNFPPLPYPQLLPSGVTKMGGNLNFMDSNSEIISFRIFSDGSHWEMFTSTGQTLTTRWYHDFYAFAGQVFQLNSIGGLAKASGIAYNMGNIWSSKNQNTEHFNPFKMEY